MATGRVQQVCGDPILNLHSRAGFHSDLGSVLNFRSWLPGGKHICSRQDPARIAHGMNFFWRRAHLLDPKAGQALQCWLWGDVFVSPTSRSWELATTQFHVYKNGDTAATVAASTLQDTRRVRVLRIRSIGSGVVGLRQVLMICSGLTPCPLV